jgi:hypothetical protein
MFLPLVCLVLVFSCAEKKKQRQESAGEETKEQNVLQKQEKRFVPQSFSQVIRDTGYISDTTFNSLAGDYQKVMDEVIDPNVKELFKSQIFVIQHPGDSNALRTAAAFQTGQSFIKAVGIGKPNPELSAPQNSASALRAAQVDAQRWLLFYKRLKESNYSLKYGDKMQGNISGFKRLSEEITESGIAVVVLLMELS